MKHLYNYVIAPMFRLTWAIIYSLFISTIIAIAFICYTIWYLDIKDFKKDFKNCFIYTIGDNDFEKYSIIYKTIFHWAFNIDGIKSLNSNTQNIIDNMRSN